MQQFVVRKEVRSEAVIARLKLTAFYLFFGIFLILVFILIGDFSLGRGVVVTALAVSAYVLIFTLQDFNLDTYIPNLPKTLINK